MNSTFNINESTKRIFLQELERGRKISSGIDEMVDVEHASSMSGWAELVEKTDFFTRYKKFVRVDIVAATKEGHRSWTGLAESQLRMFVDSLEGGLPRRSPLQAHVFPQGFSWADLWHAELSSPTAASVASVAAAGAGAGGGGGENGEAGGWPPHVLHPPSSRWCDTFFIGVEAKPNASEEDKAQR